MGIHEQAISVKTLSHNHTRVMVGMSGIMSLWHYIAVVKWNFNRYACGIGTIQSDMPPGLLKIKDNSYLTDALQLRHVN